VTSVLEENTKPSSPVWCVRSLTVKLINCNPQPNIRNILDYRYS